MSSPHPSPAFVARPGFWQRYWFLVALTLIVPAGIVFPEGGLALRRAGMVLPLLTATTLFISGFGLQTSHLRPSRANLRAIGFGLGTTYAVAPLLAWALARLVGPTLEGPGSQGHFFLEAVMIAAAQAGTIASAPALTLIAGGDQALALLLTLASNLVTTILTPLVLEVSIGAIVSFPVGEMMARMALTVLLPAVLGQAARPFLWQSARSVFPLMRILSQAIILVFVYIGVSSAADQLTARPALLAQFFVTCAALHAGLLAWVWRASIWLAFAPPARTALVFCATQKTLPNGNYLWDRFFAANPHGAMALVQYHVLQLVVDTLLVPWLRRGSRARP